MSRRDDPNRAHQLRRWDFQRRWGGQPRSLPRDLRPEVKLARNLGAHGNAFAKDVADSRKVSRKQAAVLRKIQAEQRRRRRRP